jgi:hypothetical protein
MTDFAKFVFRMTKLDRKITFMYATSAKVLNLPDPIHKISISVQEVHTKQLYLQGVRG